MTNENENLLLRYEEVSDGVLGQGIPINDLLDFKKVDHV